MDAAQAWLAFLSLTLLEIVLGIDNIIFMSILVARLPVERQRAARLSGLGVAMATRLGLLFSVLWVVGLTRPLISVSGEVVTVRDLVLAAGGLFLLAKAVLEMHHALEGAGRVARADKAGRFSTVVLQIVALDLVFSLDSVFTAIGLAQDFAIMAAAIIAAIGAMMWVAGPLGAVIQRHPTIKTLALAFLMLIGVTLIAAAAHRDIPKGYLYFAMAFAVAVELVNLKVRAALESRD